MMIPENITINIKLPGTSNPRRGSHGFAHTKLQKSNFSPKVPETIDIDIIFNDF